MIYTLACINSKTEVCPVSRFRESMDIPLDYLVFYRKVAVWHESFIIIPTLYTSTHTIIYRYGRGIRVCSAR